MKEFQRLTLLVATALASTFVVKSEAAINTSLQMNNKTYSNPFLNEGPERLANQDLDDDEEFVDEDDDLIEGGNDDEDEDDDDLSLVDEEEDDDTLRDRYKKVDQGDTKSGTVLDDADPQDDQEDEDDEEDYLTDDEDEDEIEKPSSLSSKKDRAIDEHASPREYTKSSTPPTNKQNEVNANSSTSRDKETDDDDDELRAKLETIVNDIEEMKKLLQKQEAWYQNVSSKTGIIDLQLGQVNNKLQQLQAEITKTLEQKNQGAPSYIQSASLSNPQLPSVYSSSEPTQPLSVFPDPGSTNIASTPVIQQQYPSIYVCEKPKQAYCKPKKRRRACSKRVSRPVIYRNAPKATVLQPTQMLPQQVEVPRGFVIPNSQTPMTGNADDIEWQ